MLGIALKLLGTGGIGFVLRKRRLVDATFAMGINTLVVQIVAPCTMLASAGHEFSAQVAGDIGWTALATSGYFAVAIPLMILISRTLRAPDADKRVFVNLVCFANTGFIGFPIITELYGPPGMLCAVIVNMIFNLIMFTYGVRNFAPGGKLPWRELVRKPLMIASVASIGIYLSPFRFPAELQGVIEMVGGMITPLSMMIVGISLAETQLKSLLTDWYPYLVAALRLLIVPLCLWMVLQLCGLSELPMHVTVVLFGLPCGTMNVIFAARYRAAYERATRSVVLTNVLMFVTVPVILALVGL